MTVKEKNLTLEKLIEDYNEPQYSLSAGELYAHVLPTADDEDPDSFVDRVPERLRGGFELTVLRYPLPEEGEGISFGVVDPKDETVRGLQQAFERRRSGNMAMMPSAAELIAQYEAYILSPLDVVDLLMRSLSPSNIDEVLSELEPEWKHYFVSWARSTPGKRERLFVSEDTSRCALTRRELEAQEALRSWLARNPPTEEELRWKAEKEARAQALQAAWDDLPRETFIELLKRAGSSHKGVLRYSIAFASLPEEERRRLDLFLDRLAAIDPTHKWVVRVRRTGARKVRRRRIDED